MKHLILPGEEQRTISPSLTFRRKREYEFCLGFGSIAPANKLAGGYLESLVCNI